MDKWINGRAGGRRKPGSSHILCLSHLHQSVRENAIINCQEVLYLSVSIKTFNVYTMYQLKYKHINKYRTSSPNVLSMFWEFGNRRNAKESPDSWRSHLSACAKKVPPRHANTPPLSAATPEAAILAQTAASVGGVLSLHSLWLFKWLMQWSGITSKEKCSPLSQLWSSPTATPSCQLDVHIWTGPA